jgi:hypothetical protein
LTQPYYAQAEPDVSRADLKGKLYDHQAPYVLFAF